MFLETWSFMWTSAWIIWLRHSDWWSFFYFCCQIY